MIWQRFDQLASEYDKWYDKRGRYIYQLEVETLRKVIELHDLKRPFIELGVGSGRFAEPLKIDTGVDMAPNMLKLAESRGVKVIRADLHSLPLEDDSFNTVFFIYTLCFLQEPILALREAYRILRPAGHIVIALTLRDTTWGELYLKFRAEKHRFYEFANLLSLEELENLVLSAGFKQVAVYSSLLCEPQEALKGHPLPETASDILRGYSRESGFTVMVCRK